jgi:hypothetical protein
MKILRCSPFLCGLLLVSAIAARAQAPLKLEVAPFPGQAPLGYVEIRGVEAGPFNPVLWEKGRLNWVPDVRFPILAPRMGGGFRNIYAPWAVQEGKGWRFFYSAWDGVPTANDRVYSTTTEDFIDFGARTTVIEHGVMVHVSNVNVQKLEDGSLHMICTACTDPCTRGIPVYFSSPDGHTWNGSPEPYAAQVKDIVRMEGYDKYQDGDLNGANVLLRDHDKYYLYFTNWRDAGTLYWAEGATPTDFIYGGVALKTYHAVNDIEKFTGDSKPWYLMALHKKGDVGLGVSEAWKLWYSLSNDGVHFENEQDMFQSLNETDRYIFAVGFVRSGNALLGVVYGAGPTTSLDRNQIFGRWLQKKVTITEASGAQFEAAGSLGPDRQRFKVPLDCKIVEQGSSPAFDRLLTPKLAGTVTVYAEDGVTPLGSAKVELQPGRIYSLVWK